MRGYTPRIDVLITWIIIAKSQPIVQVRTCSRIVTVIATSVAATSRVYVAMTTHGALYVTSLLVVHCCLSVVDTTFNKRQSSSAVNDTQVQHTDAAGEQSTIDVGRHATRHNRSSLHSAASLLCDGRRCQGKLVSYSLAACHWFHSLRDHSAGFKKKWCSTDMVTRQVTNQLYVGKVNCISGADTAHFWGQSPPPIP